MTGADLNKLIDDFRAAKRPRVAGASSSSTCSSSASAGEPYRSLFHRLEAEERSSAAAAEKEVTSSSSSLFLDACAPSSLSEAQAFPMKYIEGPKKGTRSKFPLSQWMKEQEHLALRLPLGLLGPPACGKTLFCKLWASANKFELITVHETEAEALEEYLQLAVNPSIDGSSKRRLWLI